MLCSIYLSVFWCSFFGITAILGCFLLYMMYCGIFTRVEIKVTKPPFRQLQVGYKFTRGKFSTCRQILSEVKTLCPNLNPFAMYHEDLYKDSNAMSYTVGVIVQGCSPVADQSTYQKLAQHGYLFVRFPAVDYVVMTTFPHVNQLSDVIGVARVYPHLNKFIRARRICAHPIIEIYLEKATLFIAPLSQQDAFYVPEALPVYESSDSDVEDEYFSTPPSQRRKSLVPKKISSSHYETGILKNVCYCDALLRSHSCDYCRCAA